MMNRFDGNTILVADIDQVYGMQLVEVLKSHGAKCAFANGIAESKHLFEKYDFEIVIANYFLADGIIHQLIEWSHENMKTPPIFTAMGYPLPGEAELLQKHSIAEVFSKSDRTKILSGLSHLLFDFQQFQKSLMEMIIPYELTFELNVNSQKLLARPIEMSAESIFLCLGQSFEPGSFAEMSFSMDLNKGSQKFVIPGNFANEASGGQYFNIDQTYSRHWNRFLNLMNEKQSNISTFIKKAAGY
jgi:hypothetical protein